MSSNSNNQTTNVENEQSVNNVNSSSVTQDLIAHDRRRSGFRRRGDTTSFQGPTGAPPLGTASMAGASGGGPAAWAAAAFGRGEERKVFKRYLIFATYNIHIYL